MIAISVLLRVTSVRSRGKAGGAIFSGTTDEGESYVAVCNYQLIPDAEIVEKGQMWRIKGSVRQRTSSTRDGYIIKENQIDASEAELARPSGQNIVTWISKNPSCTGFGQVKAQKLYDRFGPDLIKHIENKNLAELTQIVNVESAQVLCNAFAKFKIANVLLWLDQIRLPRKTGMKVIAYYKDQAQATIEANPYVLLSFEADWKRVDKMARSRFGVSEDDQRRLASAVEEVLYSGMKQGHTCLPHQDVQTRLKKLLDQRALVSLAMNTRDAGEPSRYRKIEGFYQTSGLYLIESYIATRLQAMAKGENQEGQTSLFGQIPVEPGFITQVIRNYEASHEIMFSDEQRAAVSTSVSHHLSAIIGGAGTGKTTVLKALYHVLEKLQPGVAIYQLALAGRASQRMAQATNREAMTIAGFLRKVAPAQIEIGSVVVIDEMSMVDVLLMYRLLRHLPGGVRLILVGDPSQLPPIGPGLVLHALAGLPSIPRTELKVVKRQSATTGIPKVAAAIRAHEAPVWAAYRGKPDVGVSFVPCSPTELEAKTLEIYEELGGRGTDSSVQILSLTNTSMGSVKNFNITLHNRYRGDAELIYCLDPEFGVVGASTLERVALCVDDLVIFTENDYTLGLRNGSLGRIVKALPADDLDAPCCLCEFEGIEYFLDSRQTHALNHAYAITVHKAQGSQFKRVIVPIRPSRLLDQTLIYTAVTRGIDQVVLVGDEQAALEAIKAPASSARRHIALPGILAEANKS
ncbi:MAG: hypothetical protein E6Q92_12625 [Burkholderiaceae bacterium]|nr:MAG: hypothetical protein E6Q92_12625 [Burkholderiaceae bacterium]